jgi:phosphoribosyl 1,2-cyclic phosphodiesterase
MVSSRSGSVIIDRGGDWLGCVDRQPAQAIFITHAHPDHIDGLRQGAALPVYATAESWKRMRTWPVADRRVVPIRHPIAVAGLRIEAWPVEHAINAPAVGYRVSADDVAIFYLPDVARLPDLRRALSGVDLYIGDGACILRPLVRQRGAVVIGHATIGTQLAWCEAAGVRRALFTHCGSAIVRSDERRITMQMRALARSHRCGARIAHDGMAIRVQSVRKPASHDKCQDR